MEGTHLNAIETRDLTRRFDKTVAVDRLNLAVPAGALFGLIGPNGAGKTTTLRMLAGLLDPSEGQIVLNGQVANHDWRDLQRQIGYMPDFFGVYEDMLVWEYLDFFGRCYGLSSQRRRQVTDELLELVDLAPKRDDQVETLSRGMRQRLCLAHALVHDPTVLLLDEPASGLDPRARVEMRELLRELGAMGKTIVVSSHILAELAELCDSVGIIETGRLVASGPLDEIRRLAVQGRLLHIKALSDPQQAQAVLRDQPGVGAIYRVNDSFEVEFIAGSAVDGDQATADLLEALLRAGVRVVAFNEIASDLEEVFLRLTTGDTA
ncbi:MAG: ABC transporter ATP-binding protein [Anaerolineae bacterium]|nr:ABC transporter ATP-binding protein [Anaerolineae bacterium]